MYLHRVSHGPAVPIEASSTSAAATAFTRRERGASALVFRFCLLDVYSAAVNLRHWVVLDQVLSDLLVSECDKAKATRRSRVNVFQNDGVVHFAKLAEVIL